VGLKRKRKGDEWNRMDAYTVEFHQRVRAGYLEMTRLDSKRWVVVNAERKWDEVQEELRKVIEAKLM
jgi:dTMP kinase